MMTIIVTGGAGFIGSNFIFHMLEKYPDYRIICLDCLTYAGNLSTLAPVMENPNFRFVKADIAENWMAAEGIPLLCISRPSGDTVEVQFKNRNHFFTTSIKFSIIFIPSGVITDSG